MKIKAIIVAKAIKVRFEVYFIQATQLSLVIKLIHLKTKQN